MDDTILPTDGSTDNDKLLILTGDFGPTSARNPYQILQTLNYEVDITCPAKDEGEVMKTVIHYYVGDDQTYSERRGRDIPVTIAFEEVVVDEYVGLVIPGGRAPEYLRLYDEVLSLIGAFDAAGKPIAAICHGTLLVAAADIVEGRRCTGISYAEPVLRSAGATWIEPAGEGGDLSGVVTDGNLVTAPVSSEHPELIREFLALVESD